MAFVYAVFIVLFLFVEAEGAQQHRSNLINLGSSLSPTVQPTSWKSPSGQFSFGFYWQGEGFIVGIWLEGKSETTVVWTANRDDPPMSSNATLDFTNTGKLLLTKQSEVKVIALAGSASSASMLDSGNFVLYDNDFKVIWESFRFPTDSILGGQTLLSGAQLFSGSSQTSYSTGRFRLKMQDDGNLVLYPVNSTEMGIDSYWASNTNTDTQGGQFYLFLSYNGSLVLINTSSNSIRNTIFTGSNVYVNTTIYRAIVNYDGVFQLYSHSFDANGDYKSVVERSEPATPCLVKSYCGFNSYCTMNDNQPICLCLPGTNKNQNSRGCERDIIVEQCKDGKDNAAFYHMTVMENMRWEDPPYFKALMSKEDCNTSCLKDCNCQVALFEDEYCMKQNYPLRYARREINEQSTAFFKVSNISFISNNGTTPIPLKPQVVVITRKKVLTLILVLTLGFITCSCVFLVISGFFIFKYRVVKYKRLLENGNLGFTDEITLRSFSYSELRKATNGFKEELARVHLDLFIKGH